MSGLFSGDGLLDGVRDIPNPSPGRALSIGESDGFLSGLFDDEGNFSLPDAGTVMKNQRFSRYRVVNRWWRTDMVC